jgi:hypothetical protein
MTAIIFDYAAIASRMKCDKPRKAVEEETPAKKKLVLRKKPSPVDDEDEDDDGL